MQGSKVAKSLRKRMTQAEQKLWHHLRDRRLLGYKFRRQVAIGTYVADFVCMSARLIIEVDGGQHAQATGYDQHRTHYLQGEGYQVLRFWNNEVLVNMDGVLETIALSLSRSKKRL